MPRIVYSPHYNIGFFGLERLHPFDSHKYGRAWKRLRNQLGKRARDLLVRPAGPVRIKEMMLVHTLDYLARLRDPKYVAQALELPPVRYLPRWIMEWRILRPMQWGTAGTVLAARTALECGLAINLSGGYHHAKPDGGEGFCIYNDIGIAIRALRSDGTLSSDDRIAYVDLDAHQGNGVCHVFREDDRFFIFDMYNSRIYPCFDLEALARIDCPVPITSACTEREYLAALMDKLPGFLDSVGRSRPIRLAIYNAGTDVYEGDQLGRLHVSPAGVLERDLFVIDQLRQRGIPTFMLLSGGYSPVSYQLVADSVRELILQNG
ncbi:MAG: histone deacetylase [Planctomycetia bacterium]|nr:histone deacetylase [Planctomycetia bacterium]